MEFPPITPSLLPPLNPQFDPFQNENKRTIIPTDKTTALKSSHCSKWKIIASSAIPMIQMAWDFTMKPFIIMISAYSIVKISPDRFSIFDVSDERISWGVLIATILVVFSFVIKCVFLHMIRADYDAYLIKQIKACRSTKCPATAMIFARLIESKTLREQEIKTTQHAWDSYMKNKVTLFIKSDPNLAVQYAYCILSQSDRTKHLRQLNTALSIDS